MKPRHPLPPDVQAALHDMLPEQRQRLERVWDLLEDARPRPPAVCDDATAWQALQRRLDDPAPHRDRPPRPLRPLRRRVAVGGLALLFLLALGLQAWRSPVTVTVPPGEQAEVMLPDGSTVHLNSGSRLTYTRRFQTWPFVPATARQVHLIGEAFFSVEPGTRPFIVETFNARVEVLGTRFNVRAWPEALRPETRVTLAEGHVRVRPAGADTAVALTAAGDEVRIHDREVVTPPAGRLEDATSWQHRGLALVDLPLADVLRALERHYAVEVRATPGLPLETAMTLRYFRPVTLEAVLSDLCVAQGCRFRPTSRGYELLPPSSP